MVVGCGIGIDSRAKRTGLRTGNVASRGMNMRIVDTGDSRYPAPDKNWDRGIAVERVHCEAHSCHVAQPGCG